MLPSGHLFLVYIVRKSINTSEVQYVNYQSKLFCFSEGLLHTTMSQNFGSSTWFTFLCNSCNFSCWMGNTVCLFLIVGVLILSLDKDTYEQLGLTGKPSAFQKNHRFSKCNISLLGNSCPSVIKVILSSLIVFTFFHIFSYCVHISSVGSF